MREDQSCSSLSGHDLILFRKCVVNVIVNGFNSGTSFPWDFEEIETNNEYEGFKKFLNRESFASNGAKTDEELISTIDYIIFKHCVTLNSLRMFILFTDASTQLER